MNFVLLTKWNGSLDLNEKIWVNLDSVECMEEFQSTSEKFVGTQLHFVSGKRFVVVETDFGQLLRPKLLNESNERMRL